MSLYLQVIKINVQKNQASEFSREFCIHQEVLSISRRQYKTNININHLTYQFPLFCFDYYK